MKTIITTSLISSGVLFAYAQTGGAGVQPVSSQPEQITKVSVIADVNLVNLHMTSEKDGLYAGTFALQAKMGQQNNISYGVVVTGEKGQMVAFETLGNVPSLKEGELPTFSFSYKLPPLSHSKVTVLLVAENEGGVRLSTRILAKDLEVTSVSAPATCVSPEDKHEVTCTFKESGSFTATEYNTPLGKVLGTPVAVEVKKGEKKTFTTTDKKGISFFVVTETKTHAMVIVPKFVDGAFGSVKNIAVAKKEAGDIGLTLLFAVRPAKGATFSYSLLGTQGEVCHSASALPLTDMVYEETVKTACTEGTITVTLFDSTGKQLDEKKESFSVMPVVMNAPAMTKTEEKSATRPFVSLLGGLVLIVGILFVIKQYRKSAILPVLFLCVAIGGVERSYAISYQVSTWGGPGVMLEIAHTCWVDITPDKASYAPGEAMSVTGTITITRDIGANGTDLANCTVRQYPGAFDLSLAPGAGGTTLVNANVAIANVTDSYQLSSSASLTAPATTGSHFLGTNVLLNSKRGASIWTSKNASGDMSFTVAAAPTVQLFFSMIEKVKALL